MKQKYVKLLISTIFILLILNVGCIRKKEQKYILAKGGETVDVDFTDEVINKQLQLTIYYLPLGISTSIPLSKYYVMKTCMYKIIVPSSTLHDYLDVLKKIQIIKLKKVDKYEYLDFRVYCEFTNKEKKEILSISLGDTDNMVINNLVTKNNLEFYNFIVPFIPQSEADNYRNELKNIKFY